MTTENAIAGEDIEITPEMIEAGVKEFGLFESYDPPESIVTGIFRSMINAGNNILDTVTPKSSNLRLSEEQRARN